MRMVCPDLNIYALSNSQTCRALGKPCSPSPSLPTSRTIETSPALILSSSQNLLYKIGLENPKNGHLMSRFRWQDERAEIIANQLISQDFEVCVTTYEMCLIEKSVLKSSHHSNTSQSTAHRIKNVDSIPRRLLITGTPLQNNLKVLFSLLNIICPEIFVDYMDLDSFLHKDSTNKDAEDEKGKKVVEALHKIL
jgi:SNF2 family DNA or RNA helicase